ncbi:protein-tyrosine sulfotransferase [Sarcoptes scabiei]|nr:protein-tyrosine sulfotransferase [Sarcoptes scabiei]
MNRIFKIVSNQRNKLLPSIDSIIFIIISIFILFYFIFFFEVIRLNHHRFIFVYNQFTGLMIFVYNQHRHCIFQEFYRLFFSKKSEFQENQAKQRRLINFEILSLSFGDNGKQIIYL